MALRPHVAVGLPLSGIDPVSILQNHRIFPARKQIPVRGFRPVPMDWFDMNDYASYAVCLASLPCPTRQRCRLFPECGLSCRSLLYMCEWI